MVDSGDVFSPPWSVLEMYSLPHGRFWRCILLTMVDSGDIRVSSPRFSRCIVSTMVGSSTPTPFLMPSLSPKHTSVAGLFKQHPSDVHHHSANIHSLNHTSLHTTFYVSHNKFFCIRSIHPTIISSRSPGNHHC